MTREITLTFKDVVTDGLPSADDIAAGVVFLWDGCIFDGWPILPDGQPAPDDLVGVVQWEASEDFVPALVGVRYWARVPVALHEIGRAS